MKTEQNKKIEEILESLDNCQRATVPDFFYTRLKAKMENQAGYGKVLTKKPLILRPIFALAVLVTVLLINGFVIFQNNNDSTQENTALSDTEVLQSMAVEYRLNDNSAIPYDINP